MTQIDIGSRLELMVDDFLIERMNGAQLKLHSPQHMPLANHPLITGGYMTVIKDGNLYRAYYRSSRPDFDGPRGNDGNPSEIYCYTESHDGIDWTKPDLGLCEIGGARDNNVILTEPPFCHNFSPMLDKRPDAPAEERYKALAGLQQLSYDEMHALFPKDERYQPRNGIEPAGLWAFASADGIRWRKASDRPVITRKGFSFDSQNVSFWSEYEDCYVAYMRTWDVEHGWLRSISRSTSADYRHWSDPVALDPNEPGEHLYTSQTHPYFRAPHIYIATPTRFAGDERGASTDILFMTARGNAPYERPFKEAWIRPGLDPALWGNRANYMALNVVPTSPEEMSLYHDHSGHRYALRTDGFASVHAGHAGGELLTKPLRFSGARLTINFSTSAAGSMQVELQAADGALLPGYTLDDCPPFWGDAIEHPVSWKGGQDVSILAGQPVRLRFAMKDADLFAIRFQ